MKKKEMNTNVIRVNNFVFVFIFFLFILFGIRLCYLCLANYSVGDITISEFITNRNMEEEVVMPTRGSILDRNGNTLAQDVSSYTLIAYLSPTRSEGSSTLQHVSDIEETANKLSDYLDLTVEEIKEILSKDAYQVEFGISGKNLSQIEMEEIKNLNLPGIDFIKSTKRYYPNGDFASYLIGYTKNVINDDENVWITGELGIEEYFDDTLKGKTGYITYERDRYGYKIANGREYVKDAINGSNVYLTIDDNIELFVENAIKKVQNDSEAEWSLMVVADAKTGAILGYSSTPSFDPNIRNMTSYIDPLTGYSYEPGSTMKIFSYLCAIETGNYDGSATYLSGSKTYESEIDDDSVTINDWNKIGWGTLTYDQGFALSSNIAVANLVETVINKNNLTSCYTKYGFGLATGLSLKREQSGSIDFNYQVEVATAGYGQGITTTPIQHIQALTAIGNDGIMLKPYIVSKIVDSKGKTTLENNREEIGRIASSKSITKIKELMKSVINPDSSIATGSAYYMEGYDIIGKTGTAQLYDYEKGKYLDGWTDYIYSFSGLYPADDPEIIIYTAMKKPKDTEPYLSTAVKSVIVNTSKYLNIKKETTSDNTYVVNNYKNKLVDNVKEQLSNDNIKTIILGNGNKIVKQYPNSGSTITKDESIILLTNNFNNIMPNLIGLSYKEVLNILKLMNVDYQIEGSGYVYYQNIEENNEIKEQIIIKLKENYVSS